MDKKETMHIAKLARLKFDDNQLDKIAGDMTNILGMVASLQEADTSEVTKLDKDITPLRTREDEVTIGNLSESLVKNSTEPHEHFFTVPKVVE